jgi:SAM-dependent methyltransferase
MQETLAAWLAAGEGTDEAFVDDLWLRVLRRPIEPELRERALAELRLGVSRSELLHQVVTSAEFTRVRLADEATTWAAAERRAGNRPRNVRAPAGAEPDLIAMSWCLARCGDEAQLLVVGHVHADPAYLAAILSLGATSTTAVDPEDAELPGARALRAPLASLPFDDDAFDLVLAISLPSGEAELAELQRVLTRDGRLLLAVTADGTTSTERWIELFEGAGFVVYEDELYVDTPEGWQTAAPTDGATALLCAELRPDRLGTRVRLAFRDRRRPDEPRRATV